MDYRAEHWDGEIGFIRHISSPTVLRKHCEEDIESPSDDNDDYNDVANSSDECSTDLEEDLEPLTPEKPQAIEVIYLQTCSKLKIVPCSTFVRQLLKEEIDISHYNVGPKGGQAVAAAMTVDTTTTLLNVSDNGLDEDGGVAMAKMMEENCYISTLDISSNFIGSVGVKAFGHMLERSKYLIELSLAMTRLRDDHAIIIANALKENYSLHALDLSQNDIGEEGGIAIGQALQFNVGLVYFNLSDNHIRNKGAVAIADSLCMNTTLKVLSLSGNGFGNNGAKAVGQALKQNAVLRELDLSNNRIAIEGAVGIGIGLEENVALKTLKIGRNPLQPTGSKAVVESLMASDKSTLEELYLDNVVVSAEFELLLDELLSLRPGLYIQFGTILRGKELKKSRPVHKDLVARMLDYIELRGMRILDFFRQMDKSGKLLLRKKDFIDGLRKAGIPLRMSQVDNIFDILDRNNDGLAHYREFVKLLQQQTYNEFATTRSNFQQKYLDRS